MRPRTGFLFPSLRTQPLGVGSRLGLSWPPHHRPVPDLVLGCPRRLQGGSDLTFQSSVASLHLSLPSQLDSSPAPTLPLSRVGGPASSRRGGLSGCWRGGSRDPTRVPVLLLFFEVFSKATLSRKGLWPFSGARGRARFHHPPQRGLPAPTGLGHSALSKLPSSSLSSPCEDPAPCAPRP